MKTCALKLIKSQLSGSPGLVISNIGINVYGIPAYDSQSIHDYVTYQGGALAHDLCEHRNSKDIGTLSDEFLALGASTFVRNEDYYYDNKNPSFNIWNALLSDFTDGYNFMAYNPKSFSHLHSIKLKENGISLDVDFIIDKIKTFFTKEIVCSIVNSMLPYDASKEQASKKIDNRIQVLDYYIDDIKKCLYIGHDLAVKRYKGDHMKACRTYTSIQEAVDSFFEDEEVNNLPDRLNLKLNYDQDKAFIRYNMN